MGEASQCCDDRLVDCGAEYRVLDGGFFLFRHQCDVVFGDGPNSTSIDFQPLVGHGQADVLCRAKGALQLSDGDEARRVDLTELLDHRLRARPGTASVDARFTDPECGTLTLDSRGAQGASGTSSRCWP